ncbi:MAG TPA: sugar transferase [Pseudonocardiaceae bacterium]|jgi:lipopolysaccharide/colanic/teichoic acid biosynthesis glycosyltransferase|nr:sugar transferase [Pseudonocardiaceae bacterium]
MPPAISDSRLRRCVDVVSAISLLIALSPLLVLIGAAIRLTTPGPAIYRQRRVGRERRVFTIWKFRTMVVNADRGGPSVGGKADPRITAVGKLLRGTRLDELPQLVNLLRGEVTLIGPRPEVETFVSYYTPTEQGLLSVRPGLLGPGALLFAARQSDELDTALDPDAYYVSHHLHPKLALDLSYVRDRRLASDLRLMVDALRVAAGARPKKSLQHNKWAER